MNFNQKWEKSYLCKRFIKNYIQHKQLVKNRGWNNKLISDFLGKEDYMGDTIKGNKCYPVKFYTLNRVREIEQMQVFQEAKKKEC